MFALTFSQFIQQTWANSRTFFAENAGLDAVMGQSNAKEDNDKDNGVPMGGLHPDKLGRVRKFKGINNFVIPNGGEYFFMPSMSALKGALAGAKPKGEL